MLKGSLIFPFSYFAVFCVLAFFLSVEASHGNGSAGGHFVQKHERKHLIVTEYGEISAVKVFDGTRGPFHLEFITMEPNSLFLPVLLHADMVFYVHTGSGTLSWTDDNEMRNVNIRKGDIYRLHRGSFFYVESSLEPEREKLRIHAFFSNTEDNGYEPSIGTYSSINDLVLGFDSKVLQAAFKVPEHVIAEMMEAAKPPAIIHAVSKKKKVFREWQARLLKAFIGTDRDSFGKKKKTKAYNVLEADPDFKNCNGWSLTVDGHDLHSLKDSNIGVFMVNLTKGSMMGPHWNPRASEIAIVLQGQGMIRVVCPSNADESECKNWRFRVKEGDVFAVPRFHPMAQMSFNNDSFVFMGFSTSTKRNYPQFLAGKSSVLQILDRQILAVSFNVTNTTIHQLLTPQKESIILDCTSCAEEEESMMEEEIERERKEEKERRREEEEAKKRQEEEARKREEEEAKKREEEEARKRKEEEEEARRQEEERRREEEEARKKKEEEERKREEEEARKRKEEEEEAKRRREEEARKEQEAARRQEEERQRRARQEEEERKRQEEKEKKEKEKERQKKGEREHEEPERRKERGQGEERRKREEAAAREQEEARRQEKERQRRAEQEEEEARREREREREKQGGQPEKRETEEGGDEGERILKKVWQI